MVQLSVGELQHLSKAESSLEVATPLVLSVVYPIKLGGGQDAKLSLYHCLVADGRTITWAMLTMVTDRDLAVFRVLKINRCFVSKTFRQAFPVINIVALDAKILGPMSEVLQDPVKTLEALNMVAPEPVMTHAALSIVAPEPAKTLGEADLESIDASSEKESESIDTSSEKESEPIETLSLIDTETLYELALDPFKAAKKGAVKPVENAGIPFKTVEQIGSERIGSTYSDECFFLEGTVVGIYSDSIAYPACRGSNCSYKVAEDSTSGLWLCNKCKGLWSVPRYLFEFSFDVSDDTGIIQLRCNNPVGKMLIGTTAIDAYKLGRDDRLGLDWKISAAKNKNTCSNARPSQRDLAASNTGSSLSFMPALGTSSQEAYSSQVILHLNSSLMPINMACMVPWI